MHQNLGVSRRFQDVPPRLQTITQGLVVVDLTVEDEPNRAVLVGQWLPASNKIDNGESSKSESSVRVSVNAGIVRTAMRKPVNHARECIVARSSVAIGPGCAANAAHREFLGAGILQMPRHALRASYFAWPRAQFSDGTNTSTL